MLQIDHLYSMYCSGRCLTPMPIVFFLSQRVRTVIPGYSGLSLMKAFRQFAIVPPPPRCLHQKGFQPLHLYFLNRRSPLQTSQHTQKKKEKHCLLPFTP